MRFVNVAQLKSATWLGLGSRVQVLGFYTANDGGGFDAVIDNSGDTANDVTIFQIGLSTLRAKRITSKVIALEGLGAKYGSVVHADRVKNWTILKTALTEFKEVILNGELEIYSQRGDEITLTNDVVLRGVGVNTSKLSAFPKLKGSDDGERILFEHNGANLTISNIQFDGYSDRCSFETYAATIRPSGDTDAIRVDGSIRAGFWTDLTIGETIYIQEVNTTEGYTRVVSSFNSGTGIIQCTAGFSTTDDFSTSGQTLIARAWNDDSIQSDIDTYSQQWNTFNLEESVLFKSSSISTESKIYIVGCDLKGFDTAFKFISSDTHLYIKTTKLQSNSIGISWTGASTSQLARVTIEDSEIYDCATLCAASVNTNGIIATNDRFGSGVYIHPGIIPTLRKVLFRNNNSTSWRNFSSSSNDVSGEGWIGSFTDCIWQSNNKEPLLITSKSFPTNLYGCQFYAAKDGGITPMNFGNDTYAFGCKFDVPINFNLNSEPSDNASDRYHIHLSNCTFLENCRINQNEWAGQALAKCFTFMTQCTWYIGSRTSPHWKVIGGEFTIRDLKLINKDSSITTFNDFIEVDEDSNFTSLKMDLYNVETQDGMTYTDATFIGVNGADLSSDSNFIIRLNDCNVGGFPTFSDSKITTQQFNPTYS